MEIISDKKIDPWFSLLLTVPYTIIGKAIVYRFRKTSRAEQKSCFQKTKYGFCLIISQE